MEMSDLPSTPARSETHRAELSRIAAERFDLAMGRIDGANRADPTTIEIDGRLGPKELIHSQMVSAWVEKLHPNPSQALLLAARAHHIRRWTISRSSYPSGRKGYLRWRTDLQAFHANEAARILAECGYEGVVASRVGEIIRKQNLRNDPEVQALEDALCLVFIQTQLKDVADQLEAKVLENVLKKTWEKMSHKARGYALALPLIEEIQSTLLSAVSSA